MQVAVTGATGHVGANLVRALLERGDTVRVVVYEESPALEGLHVERFTGDVLDRPSLEAAFTGAETVYHLASMITLGRDRSGLVRRINVEGAANVADACLAAGVRRLVHFSSVHALTAYPAGRMVTEERPLALEPRAPVYDRTKAAGEAVVLEAVQRGLDAVVVNPTGIIGPYDYQPSRMGQVIRDLAAGHMRILVDGGFNWADVRDVCAGAMAAASRGKTGERYLLPGHWRSMRQVSHAVSGITGVRAPKLVVPMWAARLAVPAAGLAARFTGREPRFTRASLHALRHHQQVNGAKAATDLGYAPRPFQETLADTLAWFRDAGGVLDQKRP
mgnify:CR=1 FL=1